jgi:hypothetical protein
MHSHGIATQKTHLGRPRGPGAYPSKRRHLHPLSILPSATAPPVRSCYVLSTNNMHSRGSAVAATPLFSHPLARTSRAKLPKQLCTLPPTTHAVDTYRCSRLLSSQPLIFLRPKCAPHAVLKYCHKVPCGGHIFQSLALLGP